MTDSAFECPVVKQQEFNDVIRYLSLLLFVIATLYIPVTIGWWYTRKDEPFLRKRQFELMIISAIGVYFELVVAMLGNYTGRRSFNCNVHLWLSYFIVPLAAGAVVARLVMIWAQTRYSKLILNQGRKNSDGQLDLGYFLTKGTWFSLKAALRFIFCECAHYRLVDERTESCEVGHVNVEEDNKDAKNSFQKVKQKVADLSIKQVTPDDSKHDTDVMTIVVFHLMTKRIFGMLVVLGFVLFGALMPILIKYAPSDSPFGKGCTGCHLSQGDIFLFGFGVLLIIVCGVFMLHQVKDEKDPLRMIAEIRYLFYAGFFVVFGTVLSVIDPGLARVNGHFDWVIICAIASLAIHTVQCPLQVYHTYEKNEGLFNEISDTLSGYSASKSARPLSEDEMSVVPTLDSVLSTTIGRKIFKNYLVTEYSVENVYFYDQVQRWKKLYPRNTTEEITSSANDIYSTFIKDGGMLEVNISSQIKRSILKQIGNPAQIQLPETLFDEAASEIYAIMSDDSFPRFVRSDFFKEWAMPSLAV